MTDTAELLAALVRIDSCVTPGDEIEIASFVHARLESAGIAAQLDEFEPGRANVLARIGGDGNRPDFPERYQNGIEVWRQRQSDQHPIPVPDSARPEGGGST